MNCVKIKTIKSNFFVKCEFVLLAPHLELAISTNPPLMSV